MLQTPHAGIHIYLDVEEKKLEVSG